MSDLVEVAATKPVQAADAGAFGHGFAALVHEDDEVSGAHADERNLDDKLMVAIADAKSGDVEDGAGRRIVAHGISDRE